MLVHVDARNLNLFCYYLLDIYLHNGESGEYSQ